MGTGTIGRLGLGSYAFRWSIGIGDRVPAVPMTALEVIDAAADRGLALVQFADNLPLHRLDDTELDALAARARERGVALEVGQQGSDMALLDAYLDIARRLDAPLVRLALDVADADVPQEELVAGFRAALPKAEAAGVTLAIENHFGFPSDRLAALVEAIGSARVGVCVDVANSICAGEWPEATVERLAPHAVNLHLKDYDIVPDPHGVGFRVLGTPLGDGRTDIDWVLGQMTRSGREINVVLEHWLPGDAEAGTLAAREREWLDRTVACARRHVAR